MQDAQDFRMFVAWQIDDVSAKNVCNDLSALRLVQLIGDSLLEEKHRRLLSKRTHTKTKNVTLSGTESVHRKFCIHHNKPAAYPRFDSQRNKLRFIRVTLVGPCRNEDDWPSSCNSRTKAWLPLRSHMVIVKEKHASASRIQNSMVTEQVDACIGAIEVLEIYNKSDKWVTTTRMQLLRNLGQRRQSGLKSGSRGSWVK